MGIFSKLWKGVKKTFKKIFKPIKKVFKSIGKFMNKIGIVGQIAMMFIPIPGLGALMSGLGSMGKQALGWLAGKGAIGAAAANVIGSAAKFVSAVAKPFVDITKGVTGFVKDVTKFVVNKIPGVNIASAPSSIWGKGGAWQTASETITNSFKGFGGNIASAASMDISDLLAPDMDKIIPKTAPMTSADVEATYSDALDFGKAAPDAATAAGTPQAVAVEDFGEGFKGAFDKSIDIYEPLSSTTNVKDTYSWTEDANLQTDVTDYVKATASSQGVKQGFKGAMQKITNSILDPYKKFAGDPLGTTGEAAANFISDQLTPPALYNRFTAPDMPEAAKRFQGMYISPILESSKYDAITAQQSQYPAFMQQGLDMGLFQGGYDPLPEGFMGWGGSEYNRTMAQFAPQS